MARIDTRVRWWLADRLRPNVWPSTAAQHSGLLEEIKELRLALVVELIHGGIYDELGQVSTILGTGHADPRAMGERIDRARDAFRERVGKALDDQ